jgi:hypothetical protein
MNIHRSVLVLNGNGADVAKHCVPAVPTKRFALICCIFSELIGPSHSKSDALLSKNRISITFRKMDPAKCPFNFKDDPELLNLTPLGTVVQEAGRSSNEGKSKLPDVQTTNLSKVSRGKRSKGRTSAGKVGSGILGDQPPGHDEAPAVEVLSRQGLHDQRPVSASSAERERNSGGWSREPRYQSNALGMQAKVDDIREWPRRLAQERRYGNGTNSSEDGAESGERRPRVEHRQISLINRTINDDMDPLSITSRESVDQARASVRTLYNKPRRTRVGLDD